MFTPGPLDPDPIRSSESISGAVWSNVRLSEAAALGLPASSVCVAVTVIGPSPSVSTSACVRIIG